MPSNRAAALSLPLQTSSARQAPRRLSALAARLPNPHSAALSSIPPAPHGASSFGERVIALWRLGRYRFLVGGFVLYAIGAALARALRPISGVDYALGQGVITATQLMTHYANDYFDRHTDAANPTPTQWSGGSRVLPEGKLPPRVARDVAIGLACLSVTLSGVVAWRGHATPGTLAVLVVALLLSWEYSAPPLRLHSHGLGPLTAGLVVGGLTPLAGFGMQGAPWSGGTLLAVLPLMLSQAALVLVLDFPDADGDAQTGKRTLVVMFGRNRAIGIALVAIMLTYASLPLLHGTAILGAAARGVALTLPLGAWLAWTLGLGRWRQGGSKGTLAFSGIAWFAVVSGAELAAIVLGEGWEVW
jgi:1,4-dihydroxy-2-naphthoate octaprenyltransferase